MFAAALRNTENKKDYSEFCFSEFLIDKINLEISIPMALLFIPKSLYAFSSMKSAASFKMVARRKTFSSLGMFFHCSMNVVSFVSFAMELIRQIVMLIFYQLASNIICYLSI